MIGHERPGLSPGALFPCIILLPDVLRLILGAESGTQLPRRY